MAALALAAAIGGGVAADEMVAYQIVDEVSIPKSLTGQPGDPVEGRKVAINTRLGNCLACHKMPVEEQPFHGEVGPDLAGVASRYTEGELRLRVVDPKVVNADTIMPAFYRADGFHRVMKNFQGKSVLTAEQVEDVITYLMTLKE
jgi:sulfur-oxidizing protein SoxX